MSRNSSILSDLRLRGTKFVGTTQVMQIISRRDPAHTRIIMREDIGARMIGNRLVVSIDDLEAWLESSLTTDTIAKRAARILAPRTRRPPQSGRTPPTRPDRGA